jgi:CheY-like chemotaxis protein
MENEPLRILLADDDEGDRLLFTEAFSELSVKTIVDTVNNGIQLMEWLQMKDIRLPDFIFLDLNMPRKGGIDCLKEIRNDEKLKDISVAIYSTSDNDSDKQDAFHHGANVYIAKPNNFTKLKQVLEKAVLAT